MTASARYHFALMRFGDDLFTRQDFCSAYEVYLEASAIGALDSTASSNSAQAQIQCFPATPTFTVPTIGAETPTTGASPTDTPPAPAETPTPPTP
ncbi:MAG: hypothetical protein HC797_02160 [Anaerolineales bacterium]|nr:hypothetical protein [Anaerolineales bacterium]